MDYTYKSIGIIGASIIASLLVGCGAQKLTPPHNPSDQKLVVNKNIKSTRVKSTVKNNMQLTLDNTTNSQAELILENSGDKPLLIEDIKIIDNTSLFKMTKTCGASIKGKEKCKLNLEFTGTTEGRYSALVEITSNDLKEKVKTIEIYATGKNKYQGTVEKIESTLIKPQQTVELKFNSINKTQYVKLKNDGLETLTLKRPIISGADRDNFEIAETSCASTLAVGEECQVTVNYLANKDGYSDAKLSIPSNGMISPSKYISLEGFSKPFSVEISKFVVSKNVQDFMDDYFDVNTRYYFRTIFQQHTDRAFKESVNNEVQNYFAANNFTMASTASDADKIITIYPSVSVIRTSNSTDLQYDIVLNGQVVSKSKVQNIKLPDQTGVKSLNINNRSSDTSFSSLLANNLFHDKEKFEFGLTVNVTSVSDEKDVSKTVADMMTSHLFNVLGMKDSKGN